MKDLLAELVLPIPPSANKLYATNFKTKRRFKSNEFNLFERAVDNYILLHRVKLTALRENLYKHPRTLEVERKFYFQASRIWTKTGRPKKIDTSNFIKAIDDAVAKIIGLDDSYFFACSTEKKTTTPEHEQVTIRLYELKEESCEF